MLLVDALALGLSEDATGAMPWRFAQEAMQRHRQSIEDEVCGLWGESWPCGAARLALRTDAVLRALRSQWYRAHATRAGLASIGGLMDVPLYGALGARWPSPQPAAGGVASCA